MKNPTGLSDEMIDTIIDYGWEIADTGISEQAGKKKFHITLQIYGYLDEEYDASVEFDGTDKDFVRALTELYDNFDADAYSEDMKADADEYEPGQEPDFNLCGETIRSTLNELVNNCKTVIEIREEKI